jgi:lipopolysaccharide/colanic/teichoic acid biosynthesis glycosyltransferase
MAVSIDPYYHSRRKRGLDVILAFLLLILTLPLIALISLLIFVFSGPPIIFIQKRTGQNKEPFKMYKFRTMAKGASKLKKHYAHLNQAPAPMFKIHDDPRLTKLGKNLYQLGLDELPQLINIIKGDMSLVGPRPLPIRQANKLSSKWNFRYQVKPGLFSQWTLDEDKYKSLKAWRNLEKKTINQGSLFLDIKIILKNISKQFLLIFNEAS